MTRLSEKLSSPNRASELAEVFTFTRDLAKQEIESIDRLHQRTIKSLSIIAGAFFLLTATLGWLGFANLKTLAVDTAKKQMQDEVTRRVGEKLTPSQVQTTIRDILAQGTLAQMKGMVTDQVKQRVQSQLSEQRPEVNQLVRRETTQAVSKLEPEIKQAASAETRKLLEEDLFLNHFTPTQQEKLTRELSRFPSEGIFVRADALSNKFYIVAFRAAIERANWYTEESPAITTDHTSTDNLPLEPFRTTVPELRIEIPEPGAPDVTTTQLLEALRSIGFFDVPIVRSSANDPVRSLSVTNRRVGVSQPVLVLSF